MKKALFAASTLLLICAAHAPVEQDGWITLFDGKTTNGWHT